MEDGIRTVKEGKIGYFKTEALITPLEDGIRTVHVRERRDL